LAPSHFLRPLKAGKYLPTKNEVFNRQQGDQIGRIFALCAIVYFRQISTKKRYLIANRMTGMGESSHFGRLFTFGRFLEFKKEGHVLGYLFH
jgi:hypothetical protein